jgi:hypothetical protein
VIGLYLYLLLSNDQNSIEICVTNRVTYSAHCNPLRSSLDDRILHLVFLKMDCEIYNIEKEKQTWEMNGNSSSFCEYSRPCLLPVVEHFLFYRSLQLWKHSQTLQLTC